MSDAGSDRASHQSGNPYLFIHKTCLTQLGWHISYPNLCFQYLKYMCFILQPLPSIHHAFFQSLTEFLVQSYYKLARKDTNANTYSIKRIDDLTNSAVRFILPVCILNFLFQNTSLYWIDDVLIAFGLSETHFTA